ncbi:amidohydrolase family protein [Lewinella sp. W8]|uniref:amidohydrolase family protein n=1 Tax=Lewinella sp. W8 TaxID=2528208 RepID=UPI00156549AC|nr:amidohydrolase family protein [Lewinella sp. W8]
MEKLHDCHVHALSPELLQIWRNRGVPISRPSSHYTDIDTILSILGAQSIDLISVGYFFTSPGMYSGADGRERLSAENDFILRCSARRPERVRPFVAIDLLMEDPVGEIERCRRINPKLGVKIHAGVSRLFLSEPEHRYRLRTVLDQAAQANTPVLLHFDNQDPNFGRRDFSLLLDSVLVDLPPLELRLAHLGSRGGRFSPQNLEVLNAFLDRQRRGKIPEGHQFLFDFSAVAFQENAEDIPPLTPQDVTLLNEYFQAVDPDILIFGSDYPLYTSAEYARILMNPLGIDLNALHQLTQK